MKLSPVQIAQIDETLVLNKVIYDDIKLELTDHIASDIEAIMSDRELSFEIAFKESFEKWKVQLKKESRYFGPPSREKLPKIVMDTLISKHKKFYLLTVLLPIMIAVFTMGIIQIILSKKTAIDFISNFYSLLWVVFPVLLLIGRRYINKFKKETIFSYIYVQHYWGSIMFFLIPFWNSIFGKGSVIYFPNFLNRSLVNPQESSLDSIGLIFYFSFSNFAIVLSCILFYYLYKHFQFEKKLSKI